MMSLVPYMQLQEHAMLQAVIMLWCCRCCSCMLLCCPLLLLLHLAAAFILHPHRLFTCPAARVQVSCCTGNCCSQVDGPDQVLGLIMVHQGDKLCVHTSSNNI
jgi:hypothetical protein